MASSAHIPAWRRLGLKLKYADDTVAQQQASAPASYSPAQGNGSAEKFRFGDELNHAASTNRPEILNGDHTQFHRKAPSHVAISPPSHQRAGPAAHTTIATPRLNGEVGKKRKRHTVIHQGEPSTPKELNAINPSSHQTQPAQESESEEKSPSSKVRRKSVTFTPDTKTEDGNNSQKLYTHSVNSQADSGISDSNHVADGLDVNPADGHVASENVQSQVEIARRKAQKRQKREEKSKGLHTPDSPYVNYLQQFYTARDRWKFNKHQQNQLLKHVFNLYRVPEVYDPAIEAYIGGLQGLSIRKRLQEAAVGILSTDPTTPENGEIEEQTMDDSERHRKAKEDALQKRLQDHDRRREMGAPGNIAADTRMQELKRRRAQMVLSALGEDHPLYPVQAFVTEATSNGSAGNGTTEGESKRIKLDGHRGSDKRLRKQRQSASSTGDSSSDSSISNSEKRSSEEQSSPSGSGSSGTESESNSSQQPSSTSGSSSSSGDDSNPDSQSTSGSSSRSTSSGSESEESGSGEGSDEEPQSGDDNGSTSSSSSSSSSSSNSL